MLGLGMHCAMVNVAEAMPAKNVKRTLKQQFCMMLRFKTKCSLANALARKLAVAQVVTKFTPILMYPRLKVFNAMFAAKRNQR